MRFRRVAAAVATAAAAVLGLPGTVSPSWATEAPHRDRTLLLIQVQLTPTSALQTWLLRCDPAAGSHPDPDQACAVLDNVRISAFRPVPPGTMCTEIYGGPERAWVAGRWHGRRVWATFTRANGCEIARWNAVRPLLQPARR
jgi:hypothetical protein